MIEASSLLRVRDLRKSYRSGDHRLEVLRGVDFDLATVAHDELVDGIVDHFFEKNVNPVVGRRAVAELTDVHSGPQANVFARLERADVLFVIIGGHFCERSDNS
jgi:hypothetical protein